MHIGLPAANTTINTFALFYGYATSTRNAYELERGWRAFAITRGRFAAAMWPTERREVAVLRTAVVSRRTLNRSPHQRHNRIFDRMRVVDSMKSRGLVAADGFDTVQQRSTRKHR